MLIPTRKLCSLKNAAHSSLINVPLVWMVCWIVMPGRRVLLRVLDRAFEEVQPHQRRLAALPGDGDFRRAMRLDQLADVVLQLFIGHAKAAAGIQHLFGQEEAVGAIEIADRAGGFGSTDETPAARCQAKWSVGSVKVWSSYPLFLQ